MKIAINIPTEKWYFIIESLKKSGWSVVTEYNLFNKGIDYDLYELKKKRKKYFLFGTIGLKVK